MIVLPSQGRLRNTKSYYRCDVDVAGLGTVRRPVGRCRVCWPSGARRAAVACCKGLCPWPSFNVLFGDARDHAAPSPVLLTRPLGSGRIIWTRGVRYRGVRAWFRRGGRVVCPRVCSGAGSLRFASVFSAPEFDVEASFEAGEAGYVRPCCAREDVVHGLWGDAALVGHGA